MTALPILLVEDDFTLRDALAETLELADYRVLVATDGEAALQILGREEVAAVVTDYQMTPMDGYELLCTVKETRPGLPVLLMTAHGTIQHAVQTLQEGATDYLVKPFEAHSLLEKLRRAIPQSEPSQGMIAADPRTLEILSLAQRVAATDTTVLLTGESGTGKEVFAHFIHQRSKRDDAPFVAVNCAAIPENMLEATLFGHDKGAFTGAHVARPGKFELAQHGTLLLDEISEIDLSLQAKLLRVLQEREVERVGGKSAIKLDVRIVATSNRDLHRYVAEGRFREDLYYRLSVFPIHLPALRERIGDVVPLARHFLEIACQGVRSTPELDPTAESRLMAYSWPGNVRELQNLMLRALVLLNGNCIRGRDLRLETFGSTDREIVAQPIAETADSSALQANLRSVEEQLVVDALQQSGGSRKMAAELLSVSPRTLRYKIARLREAGVEVPDQHGRISVA